MVKDEAEQLRGRKVCSRANARDWSRRDDKKSHTIFFKDKKSSFKNNRKITQCFAITKFSRLYANLGSGIGGNVDFSKCSFLSMPAA